MIKLRLEDRNNFSVHRRFLKNIELVFEIGGSRYHLLVT